MDVDQKAIGEFAIAASQLLPHRFDIIDVLADGPSIPMEALSEDHTIGIYGSVAPRKMRDNQHLYSQADIAEFAPQIQLAPHATGVRCDHYLEYVPLRGVRFRVEQLQYLEEGWWSSLPEVKYPTHTVLTLLSLVFDTYGSVFLYLNKTIPMPLWIRTAPITEADSGVQLAIQARAGDRLRPTNIHTEAPMDFARRWADGVRDFFDTSPEAG